MLWMWIGFIVFVLGILALDLGVFHRKAHTVSVREALGWSAVWVSLGLLFAVFVYFGYDRQWLGLGAEPDAVDGSINGGRTAAVKYLTGYIVEKSLSVDNIFVILMIFGSFAVPTLYQHRVLYWGILGALVMRGAMIAVGYELIAHFHWVLYVFGAFLIVTAVKMLVAKGGHTDPAKNPVVRFARRFFPVTDRFYGGHFVVREQPAPPPVALAASRAIATPARGKRMLTPLALALGTVEFTDLVFAVDSIPAVFAITADPFLVFTSNVFAMLGLRSLCFALAGVIKKFRYLQASLAVVLALVGTKMLAAEWLKHTLGSNANFYLLGLVLGILAAGIALSLLVPQTRVSSSVPATGQPSAT